MMPEFYAEKAEGVGVMFASKTARDLPWHPGQKVVATPMTIGGCEGSFVVRDYVQHNAPNPVLVEARIRGDYADMVGQGAKGAWSRNYGATDGQVTHARAVLTRLQSVDWSAWRNTNGGNDA
jgi:hypothetical protein